MSTPDSDLDKQLRALFGGLDTRADFDVRLMARIHADPETNVTQRALSARQQEQARYRSAVAELQSRHRSMLRLLTLDTLGIALLLVFAIVTSWPQLSRSVADIWGQYSAYIATVLAMLIAAVPLAGMWAEHTRGPRGEALTRPRGFDLDSEPADAGG